MNTTDKGKITESVILSKALQLGIIVSIPFGNQERYDQIWDINGKLLKIQIKTSHPRRAGGDAIEFNCYSSVNGKRYLYNKEQIDYFATIWENQVYLIPVEECSTEKVLWFNPSSSRCISLAKDYLLEERLNKI